MKKSISPRKNAVKKPRVELAPGWKRLPVKLTVPAICIADAIAFVRTRDDAVREDLDAAAAGDEAQLDALDPWTRDQVLTDALQEGLLALEKEWLGTRSLDAFEPRPGEAALPKSTPVTRALLHLLRSR